MLLCYIIKVGEKINMANSYNDYTLQKRGNDLERLEYEQNAKNKINQLKTKGLEKSQALAEFTSRKNIAQQKKIKH